MSMTTDPKAKEEIYLARFYRDGKMIHVQRDTPNTIAVLCGESGARADIVVGERVVGGMTPDGLIDWYEEVNDLADASRAVESCW